ncbi:MAG TPA: homoserine kinase [Opitutaceae bacterium]|nr:homoserine kinase [Opitutaceae bacterium]
MTAPRETVTVRVPASTSNCGAGFDTLGLALSLYNRVTLSRSAKSGGPRGERTGDGRAQEMVAETAAAFFRAAKREPSSFVFRIEGDVPPARGLGSSVTVIAGVLAGLDALHGTKMSRHQLVELATAQEGHPDNASAGILGGFCVSRCDPASGGYVDTVRIQIPADLAFVVASPNGEMPTKEARGVLPATLPYFDAVKSINSAAYFTAALATGDYEKLRHAVADFMHEPYRLPRIAGGREAIVAGVGAGAYTGWLSGSGSSVLCVSSRAKADAVLAAMRAAFARVPVPCEGRVLLADNDGLRVE